MKWIITKDHVNGQINPKTYEPFVLEEPGIGCAVGRNPTDKCDTPARVAEYANELPCEFRLLDDDMNTYFEGRCADPGLYGADEVFEPLDRIGEGYGAVHMEYRKVGAEEWEML